VYYSLEKKHKQIANMMKPYYVGCGDTLVDVGKKRAKILFKQLTNTE
jgi:hypothetical protein